MVEELYTPAQQASSRKKWEGNLANIELGMIIETLCVAQTNDVGMYVYIEIQGITQTSNDGWFLGPSSPSARNRLANKRYRPPIVASVDFSLAEKRHSTPTLSWQASI